MEKNNQLEQLKEASKLLDDLIIRYYTMVYDYYGVPRDTCVIETTVHEQARLFKKRFNLDIIKKAINLESDEE